MNLLKKLTALTLLSLCCFCSTNLLTAQDNWVMNQIGTYDWFYEIKIGDGRNDGVNRLYTATFDGHLLEWTYNQEAFEWEMIECGEIPGNAPPVQKRIISIWIEQGRNDGLNRIYGACVNGWNYEFSYNSVSDSWEMEPFGYGYFQTGIVVGNSRNDNVNRVVSTGYNVRIKEHSWVDNSWTPLNVSSTNIDVWPGFIGDGRNDNINRIYAPNWSQNFLHEYSWNGSSYDEVTVNMDMPLVKTITGEGRNDGITRIYSAELNGHVVETYWNGTEWVNSDIMEGIGFNHSRYGLCFGKTHDDDINRLYSVAQNGAFREHYFEDGEWNNTEVDAISGATADLTVGDARNDNVNRVYVAGSNGNLYEYTHADFINLLQTMDIQDMLLEEESFTLNLNDYFNHNNGNTIVYTIYENSNPGIIECEIDNGNLTITKIANGETTLTLLAQSEHEHILATFSIKTVAPYLLAGFGHCYNFSGDEEINLGNTEFLNFSENLTCQLWINPQEIGNTQEIIGKSYSIVSGWNLTLTNEGKLKFFLMAENSSNRTVTSNTVLEENNWYHISLVYDGYNSLIYINGNLDNQTTSDEQRDIMISENSDLKVGRVGSGSYYYSGKIDDIRIWDKSINHENTSIAMGNNLIGNEEYLICYLNFDEGFGRYINNIATDERYEIHNNKNQNWEFSDMPVAYFIALNEGSIAGILPNNNAETVEYSITEDNCTHGELTLLNNGSGEFSYQINTNEIGEDSFIYKISSGEIESNEIEGVIKIISGIDITNFPSTKKNSIVNHPNPFQKQTTISFNLPKAANVELKITDIYGSNAVTLINTNLPKGEHKVNFNNELLPAGVYTCILTVEDQQKHLTKMIILK